MEVQKGAMIPCFGFLINIHTNILCKVLALNSKPGKEFANANHTCMYGLKLLIVSKILDTFG